MADGGFEIRSFTGGGFGENAYLLAAPGAEAAIVIDPGPQLERLEAALAHRPVAAILLTHAHLDHVEGVAATKRRHPDAPIYLHSADRPLYDQVAQQAAMFGVPVEPPPVPDHDLAGTDSLEIAGCRLEVRPAPGHSPGHVIFYIEAARAAFVGDVVFLGSIGRTDLPGGDYATLMKSIRSAVLTLPEETTLYSGHGPETTVRHERRTNPFLVPQYGGGLA